MLEKDESGNAYLHLVLPASSVNFLNGGTSFFDFAKSGNNNNGGSSSHFSNSRGNFSTDATDDPSAEGEGDEHQPIDYDDVFIELGCKVYEVNKVYYRGGARSAAI